MRRSNTTRTESKSTPKTSTSSRKKVQFSEETPEVAYTHPEALSETGEMNPTKDISVNPGQLVGCKIRVKSLNKYEKNYIGTVVSSDANFINVLDEKGKQDRYHVLKGCLYNVYSQRYYRYTIFAKNYFKETETYDRRKIKIDYPKLRDQILRNIRNSDFDAWVRITNQRYKKTVRIQSYRKNILRQKHAGQKE